jgi:hypothetical protein
MQTFNDERSHMFHPELAPVMAVGIRTEIHMARISLAATVVAMVIVAGSTTSFAQGGGVGTPGAAAGSSAAGGTPGAAAGSAAAGSKSAVESPGAGTAGVANAPSRRGNVGGLNTAGNNSSGAVSQSPPGTNSLGTANSSSSGATTGTAVSGPQISGDVAMDKEDKAVDRKIKSICKGC